LDHFEISFDNVHVFSYWDFRDAFQANITLKHDFEDFVFHAFPYVDRSFIENLGLIDAFRQWIRLSRPEHGRLNIASCHGSSIDGTLDPHILNAGFDYVALGHDHSRGRINDRAWQAGSTERWSFKEAEQRKGYLLVDVEKDSLPRIKEIEVPPRRPMIDERIDITPETRTMDIRDQIWGIFESNNLVKAFDYETAGRVKVKVAGSSSRETTTRLYRELEAIKSEALHSDELNIVQFRFERETPDKVVFRAGPTYADIQYLIENPREELLSFLREKGVEEGYDMSLMGLLFEEAIRKSEEQI
jgi:DNA repair exonuclease SbcCD nuclease subunit